jgi:hypothetical protein
VGGVKVDKREGDRQEGEGEDDGGGEGCVPELLAARVRPRDECRLGV